MEKDQLFHHTSVTSTHLFFKACVISMTVRWHHPSQPIALLTLFFPPGCSCCNHPHLAPGKGFVSSQIKSLVLLAAWPHGRDAERGRLIEVASGLQGLFLPWPERRARALGLSLGAEWQRMRQGRPAAGPRAWPPRAGTAPWASLAQGLPRGQPPKGLPPKDAGRR